MTRRSLRWDSPTTAAVAGGLTLVLLVVDLVLSFAEHNFTSSVDGALYAIMTGVRRGRARRCAPAAA